MGYELPFYEFAPDISSATIARRYGISYVLEKSGAVGPSGGVFDARVGNEVLYRMPGAATATLVPGPSSGGWPSIDAPGTAVPVKWPTPSTVRMVTTSSSPQVLRLRVASVPGWHATIDGRPLALAPYLTMMFQARIPPGRHVIELRYWPNRFTAGLLIAACTVILLVIAAFIAWRRLEASGQRRPRPRAHPRSFRSRSSDRRASKSPNPGRSPSLLELARVRFEHTLNGVSRTDGNHQFLDCARTGRSGDAFVELPLIGMDTPGVGPVWIIRDMSVARVLAELFLRADDCQRGISRTNEHRPSAE